MAIPEAEAKGTPDWIVTFTDLMSLLLTFFILLLTFSTPRVEKLWQLRGSISGAFGIMIDPRDNDSDSEPHHVRQGRDEKNPRAARQMDPYRAIEVHDPNMEIMVLKDRSGEEIDFERVEDGWRVSLQGLADFDPGSDELSSESFSKLERFAQAMEFKPFNIVVVGYSDERDRELVPRVDDLALRRAMRVIRRLVSYYGSTSPEREGVGLHISQFAIAGYGPHPDNPVDRGIEIILVDERDFGGRGGY